MRICRICANANNLTGKPIPGSYECENCHGAGQNTGFEVDSMTPDQVAKAESAHETFTQRILEKVAAIAKRGLKGEQSS